MSSNDKPTGWQEALFQYEAFAIGSLQTISAALTAGLVSSSESLPSLIGALCYGVAVSLAVLSFGAATISSVARYRYRLYDLKQYGLEADEGDRRRAVRDRQLKIYRAAISVSLVCILSCMGAFLVGYWSAFDFANMM